MLQRYVYLAASIFNMINCYEYIVVPAIPTSNYHEIVDVINQAYKRVPFLTNRITMQELTKIIESKTQYLYLCTHNNKICGTILLDVSHEKAELHCFAVHPDYQAKGVGKKLLNHLEQQAALLNFEEIYLQVIPFLQEELVKYYIKNGYKFTGDFHTFDQDKLQRYIKKEYWNKVNQPVMYKKIKPLYNQ